MSYPNYYENPPPNRGPPPPHHAYYHGHPGGYPPAPSSANGYPPQSPTQQGPPPMRSHTAFPGATGYAPPPPGPGPGGYYGGPPPPSAGPPPSGPPSAHPSHGGHPGYPGHPPAPAPGPPAPAPPNGAPAPAPGPPAPGPAQDPFQNLPPESIQNMIDRLQSLQTKNAEPAPGAGQAPPTPVTVGAGVSPHTHHAMPPPVGPPGPQGRHGGPPPPGHYPPYGYGRPPSPDEERSPPPPMHAQHAHHHSHGHPPPGYPISPGGPGGKMPMPMTPGGMPGSFYPEAPAPPPAGGKQQLPPAPGRPEPSRKVSEQASEFSYTSASTQSGRQSVQALMQPWDGLLVSAPPGHEPKPKPKLKALFRGIAQYMIMDLEPKESVVVTVGKLLQFYQVFNMGPEEEIKWKAFVNYRSYGQLSATLCGLNVDHHLVPPSPGATPAIPGLTPNGFETWMFTQLMTAPDREARRLQKVIDRWPIFDFQAREFLPKILPRECFPPQKDPKIHAGWWTTVSEDYPQDIDPESEEDKPHVPLSLPEPPMTKPRRPRNYSLRGGKHHADRDSDEPEPAAAPPPPPPAVEAPPPAPKRGRAPYGSTGVDPRDYLTSEEKDISAPPGAERYARPYGTTGNPSWREDPNPRPTLGEEPVPRPPTRSRSTRAPGAPAGAAKPSTRKSTKRGRSVRPARRDPSPSRRYNSDDDDDDDYGPRYEADGLYAPPPPPRPRAITNGAPEHRYDDRSPPTRATTPHHYRSAREPSRPPGPRGAPTPAPPEKADIREYTYQDQYERDYARRHGPGGGSRRSGHYSRYPPS
ncbi:hypothetical protein EDC01DRAFT_524299 [Geopyxis carbonaria]|nr:hypothetical protein EDC01DRAFT_524299 [Geopyxis carbonaria]